MELECTVCGEKYLVSGTIGDVLYICPECREKALSSYVEKMRKYIDHVDKEKPNDD